METLHVIAALLVVAILWWALMSDWRESFTSVGEPSTILVSVASYRDEECSKTIEDMFANATNPSRVFVAVCEQNKEGQTEEQCAKSTILQRYGSNIRLITLDYTQAKGPTYARALCASLWKGEDYFVQVDSHTRFVKGWDDMVISMLARCPTHPAVITHYAPDMNGAHSSWDASAHVPVMCDAFFNNDSIPAFKAVLQRAKPGVMRPVPFVSCNFWAARGQVLKDVPFDDDLPQLFVGEEQLLSARLWTSGYDIYTPDRNICQHFYIRAGKPKFWEDISYRREQKETLKKVRYLLGLSNVPPLKPVPLKYGMGTKRTVTDYWAFARVNIRDKTVESRKTFCEG